MKLECKEANFHESGTLIVKASGHRLVSSAIIQGMKLRITASNNLAVRSRVGSFNRGTLKNATSRSTGVY